MGANAELLSWTLSRVGLPSSVLTIGGGFNKPKHNFSKCALSAMIRYRSHLKWRNMRCDMLRDDSVVSFLVELQSLQIWWSFEHFEGRNCFSRFLKEELFYIWTRLGEPPCRLISFSYVPTASSCFVFCVYRPWKSASLRTFLALIVFVSCV